MDGKLLNAAEIADYIGIPVERVYSYVRTGILPSCRIGRQIRFNPQSIKKFVDSGGKGYKDHKVG